MLIEGEPLKITCFSYTTPVWTYSGLSNGNYKDYMLVKRKYVYGTFIYAPKAIQLEHMGIFYCKGTRLSGEDFSTSSRVYLGCKCFIKVINYNKEFSCLSKIIIYKKLSLSEVELITCLLKAS